jgi:uncharacterized delta-60 repeat protein
MAPQASIHRPARRRSSRPSGSTGSVVCEPLECRRLMAAGDLDLAFGGGDGRTSVTFPGSGFEILDTALQTDGKIVLAGRKGSNAAVVRLNIDGSLDTTFGSGGLFEYGGIPFDLVQARTVAVAGDRIVVGGFCSPGINGSRFTVGRLTANGARDTSFGGGLGIVRSEVDENNGVEDSLVNDLAIQTDGKIVAVGRSVQEVTASHEWDMVAVRYNVNGTHDTGFADGDGTAVIEIEEYQSAHAVTIDYTDNPLTNPRYGTIVVVGDHQDHSQAPQTNFVVARLHTNGTADNSLDGDGRIVSPSLSGHGIEIPSGVAVQPGGRIVVGGTSGSVSDPVQREFLMARYRVNGAPDTTFGADGNGAVELDLGGNDRAESLALNFQGGIVLSGVSDGRFALAAFDEGGDPDNRFSGDGILTTEIPGNAIGLVATRDVFPPTRRLVVAGGSQVARLVDVGSIISVGSGDPDGSEAGREPARFFVGRTEALPFAERVFLSVGGTARAPFQLNADYEGSSNITFGNTVLNPTFVDIPAGENVVSVTITPFDDARVEGDETVIFAVAPNAAYDLGTPAGTTLAIRDNDLTGGPAVTASAFVFDAGPPHRVTFTFSQSVLLSLNASDFTVTGPSGPVPFTFTYATVSNTATLSFAGFLPDGNYTARAVAAGITNGGGQPMAADATLAFFALAGDVNRDRSVNGTDFAILARNFGKTGMTYAQGDLNGDGSVNGTDFAILAGNFGKSVPPSPAAAAPRAGVQQAAPREAAVQSPAAPTRRGPRLRANPTSAAPVIPPNRRAEQFC